MLCDIKIYITNIKRNTKILNIALIFYKVRFLYKVILLCTILNIFSQGNYKNIRTWKLKFRWIMTAKRAIIWYYMTPVRQKTSSNKSFLSSHSLCFCRVISNINIWEDIMLNTISHVKYVCTFYFFKFLTALPFVEYI